MKKSILLVLVLFSHLLPNAAHAFKLKTHVAVVNRTLAEITDSQGAYRFSFDRLRELEIENDALVEAVTRYPAFFRAGALGPDAYPDLAAGQLWAHVNNGQTGCGEGERPGPPGTRGENGGPCVASGQSMESRKFGEWRSVDYGMYLLRMANEYGAAYSEERKQAIAFAYGYLAHVIGDGFAHSYVNDWVRSYFEYFSGHGVFGPATEELQHMAIEGLWDTHLDIPLRELEISTPVGFLKSVYSEPVRWGDREARGGSFAGEHFEELVELRDVFDSLSSRYNWQRELGSSSGTALVDLLLLHHEYAVKIATFGTEIGDPIADMELYFGRRAEILDGLLGVWVQLSGCTGQNLLLGTAFPTDAVDFLDVDACSAIDFERTWGLSDDFSGALNDAAWYGNDQRAFDFGSLANNSRKFTSVVELIAGEVLRYDPLRDTVGGQKLYGWLNACDRALLDWPSCADACEAIAGRCGDVLCVGCPNEDGKYNCDGWFGGARCVLMPHCLACAGKLTSHACEVAVGGAVPVCTFCGENPLCSSLETLDTFNGYLEQFTQEIMGKVVEPLVDELRMKLLEVYAGEYVYDYIETYRAFEHAKHRGSASRFTNMAFVREDMRADPGHLDRMLSYALGEGHYVDLARDGADAVAYTVDATAQAGGQALAGIAELVGDARPCPPASAIRGWDCTSPMDMTEIWSAFVQSLYAIRDDEGFELISGVADPAFYYLDHIVISDAGGDEFATRHGKFLALMSQLELFVMYRGPTARALFRDLGLSSTEFENEDEVIELDEFHVSHNALQLTKMSLMGESALDQLLGSVPGEYYDADYERSAICGATPHIVCDAVQSLDDPNNYGESMRPGTEFGRGSTAVDVERSVVVWESRDYEWKRGAGGKWSIGPTGYCRSGVTGFALASSDQRLSKLYSSIFRGPEDCLMPFSDTWAAILVAISPL